MILDLKTRQAEGNARTEVNSAGNTGNFFAMETAQVEYIQWISASDGRVRETHMLQHAMVVKREARFPNNLKHPGDRSDRLDEFRIRFVVFYRCYPEILRGVVLRYGP